MLLYATHNSAGSVPELMTQVENDLQLSDIADVTDRQVLTDANDPVMFTDKRITTATIDFLINRPCQLILIIVVLRQTVVHLITICS